MDAELVRKTWLYGIFYRVRDEFDKLLDEEKKNNSHDPVGRIFCQAVDNVLTPFQLESFVGYRPPDNDDDRKLFTAFILGIVSGQKFIKLGSPVVMRADPDDLI
jgi:hypothetical protein